MYSNLLTSLFIFSIVSLIQATPTETNFLQQIPEQIPEQISEQIPEVIPVDSPSPSSSSTETLINDLSSLISESAFAVLIPSIDRTKDFGDLQSEILASNIENFNDLIRIASQSKIDLDNQFLSTFEQNQNSVNGFLASFLKPNSQNPVENFKDSLNQVLSNSEDQIGNFTSIFEAVVDGLAETTKKTIENSSQIMKDTTKISGQVAKDFIDVSVQLAEPTAKVVQDLTVLGTEFEVQTVQGLNQLTQDTSEVIKAFNQPI